MNKRIKKLANQAGLNDIVLTAMGIDEEVQTFAELIVRECFSKLIPYMDDQFITDIESELKEHFGVE